jgi:cleavage and polyadenylation specificity factor subunit 5
LDALSCIPLFQYPYVPSGSEPKERIRVFLIQLPERALFNVPSNLKMTAAPMHEMHGSGSKYGPIISSLPVLLSG